MRRTFTFLIIATIFLGILSFTGCKKEEGLFDIDDLHAEAYRNLIENNSYLYCICSIYSGNLISGKIVDWTFRIYDADNELLLDINDANQDSLGYEITVEKSPIQSYFSGKASFYTTDPVQGDIFNGKEPKKVIFRGTVEDQNGYTFDFAEVGPVNFQETK